MNDKWTEVNAVIKRFGRNIFLALLTGLIVNTSLTTLAIANTATTAAPEPGTTQKPWEFGLGVGAVSGPDYRGSKEDRSYVSPFPYFVYRGKFLQSDRDGVRGQFLKTDRFDFNLSLSANITPEAHKNTLRETLGLGELGSSLELGPALAINLFGDKTQGLSVVFPLRAVFMIGGDDTGYTGYTLQPHFLYRLRLGNYGLGFRSGVGYADANYHRYYYDIAPEFATANYQSYRAKGGYSGFSNQFSIGRGFGPVRAALFVRHDHLGGAAFEDSPLVETDSSLRGGLALIWAFK